MTTLDKIVLEQTEKGWRVTHGYLPHDSSDPDAPVEETRALELPRWPHWYQRRLVRVWMAVMLSLNIEPTTGSRAALRKTDSNKYQEYVDRRDIATALVGAIDDLPVYENHMREGEGAGEQYVALVDFYRFAVSTGWRGLEPMREGLKMETSPPLKVSKSGDTNSRNAAHRMLIALLCVTRPNALDSEASLLALKPELLGAKPKIGPGFTLSSDTVETHLKDVWEQLQKG